MSQNITKGIKTLLAEANAVVAAIPVEEAKTLIDSENHVLEVLLSGASVSLLHAFIS